MKTIPDRYLTMKAHAALVFLFVCSNCILYARTEKFAVLVATTKSWLHYGHQVKAIYYVLQNT